MGTQKTTQLVIEPRPNVKASAGSTRVALFNPDGTPVAIPVAATTTVKGTVNRAPAQVNSTATDVAGLVADFNALLAKLRTAGILTP